MINVEMANVQKSFKYIADHFNWREDDICVVTWKIINWSNVLTSFWFTDDFWDITDNTNDKFQDNIGLKAVY